MSKEFSILYFPPLAGLQSSLFLLKFTGDSEMTIIQLTRAVQAQAAESVRPRA